MSCYKTARLFLFLFVFSKRTMKSVMKSTVVDITEKSAILTDFRNIENLLGK